MKVASNHPFRLTCGWRPIVGMTSYPGPGACTGAHVWPEDPVWAGVGQNQAPVPPAAFHPPPLCLSRTFSSLSLSDPVPVQIGPGSGICETVAEQVVPPRTGERRTCLCLSRCSQNAPGTCSGSQADLGIGSEVEPPRRILPGAEFHCLGLIWLLLLPAAARRFV